MRKMVYDCYTDNKLVKTVTTIKETKEWKEQNTHNTIKVRLINWINEKEEERITKEKAIRIERANKRKEAIQNRTMKRRVAAIG